MTLHRHSSARAAKTTAASFNACFSLALLAAAATARAQQSTLRTVSHADCIPQFKLNGITYSGCITVDSPASNQPWCPLANPPAGGPSVAICQVDTIPARTALLIANNSRLAVPCDQSTSIPSGGSVFGCFTEAAPGSQLQCNSGTRGLLPCILISSSTSGSAATSTGDPANSNATTSNGDGNSASSSASSGLPTSLIVGIGVGVALAVISLILFCCYRNRRKTTVTESAQNLRAKKPNENPFNSSDTSTLSNLKISDTSTTLASGGTSNKNLEVSAPVARTKPRSSSQYGSPGARMSIISVSGTAPGADIAGISDEEPFLGKYMIAATYTPTLTDEIAIQPGDVVAIFEEFDDGWCSAMNLSRGMTRGVFPMHCIDTSKGRLDA